MTPMVTGVFPTPYCEKSSTSSRGELRRRVPLTDTINPTRVPIEQKESWRWLENMCQSTMLLGEPTCCIHIGDRESDIYELFYTAYDLCTHFLVRTCVDRLAGDGRHTIAKAMQQVQVKGLHRVELREAKGRPLIVTLELRYRRMTALPPVGKQGSYPAVLHAQGRDPPPGRPRSEWKLISDLPVRSCAGAIEKLD